MPRRTSMEVGKQVAAVRRALRGLERSLMGLARAVVLSKAEPRARVVHKGRRPSLSPSRLRALKLHGRYLGYIRQLKPRQRAEVKLVREKKGVEAAIARARKLAAR